MVFWTTNRSEKYEAKVGFQYLSIATRDSLAAIKESGAAFLWYPESVAKPDEIYLVNWTSPFSWRFASVVLVIQSNRVCSSDMYISGAMRPRQRVHRGTRRETGDAS